MCNGVIPLIRASVQNTDAYMLRTDICMHHIENQIGQIAVALDRLEVKI